MRAYDLFCALDRLQLIDPSLPLWWPNAGSFEVIVGVILTQQTKWEKVQISLQHLQSLNLLSLDSLVQAPQWVVAQAITPSGFYNTKAQRLLALCHAIQDDFGDFVAFQESVSRRWLLKQKGIGFESADTILCYGCYQEAMVVDAYTAKLLQALEIFSEDELQYEVIQDWIVSGLDEEWDKIEQRYDRKVPRYEIYARMHGMIVEFCKKEKKKEGLNVTQLTQ